MLGVVAGCVGWPGRRPMLGTVNGGGGAPGLPMLGVVPGCVGWPGRLPMLGTVNGGGGAPGLPRLGVVTGGGGQSCDGDTVACAKSIAATLRPEKIIRPS